MADGHKAFAAILILLGGAAYVGYNLVPQRTPAQENNLESLQKRTSEANGVLDGGQCSGVLKLVEKGMDNTITLVDDYGADCTVGETKNNRELVLKDCEEGHWCAVVGQVRPDKTSDAAKGVHVFVNHVFLAMQLRNRLPKPTQQADLPASSAKPPDQTADGHGEDKYELELRSLGSKNVNEGITRERYVRHSYLQLTNVSGRTIKIEEWWINRRRGAPLCSKTSEMEANFSSEAAKLKRETGKDISGLLGRQLRPLKPGEFLTLDLNDDYCGAVFRVDVRTDRQTEFWTTD